MESNNQYKETVNAVIGHTALAARMKDAGMDFDTSGLLGAEIDAYNRGDMNALVANALTNYDSSGDYWKLTHGGQIVNDGQGWLVYENGNKVLDKNGNPIGGNGVETGLLNILAGTSGRSWDTFSETEIDATQKLMISAGMIPINGLNAAAKDRKWSTKKGGQKLNMYDFMSIAGTNVADVIFETYYNNTVDSQLAKAWGIDLGFERNNAVPEILAEKYSSLVNKHVNEIRNPTGLENKYKFSVYDSSGVGTKLFSIDENNPFLDSLLKQGDKEFSNLEYMTDYGCNFMASIAYPQLLTGNIFNSDQIKSLWNEAGRDSSVLNITKDKSFGEGSVTNPDKLTDLAFSMMGKPNLGLSFNEKYKQPHDNIIGYKLKLKYGNGYHFVSGGINYSIMYNSGWTTKNIERKDGVKLDVKN